MGAAVTSRAGLAAVASGAGGTVVPAAGGLSITRGTSIAGCPGVGAPAPRGATGLLAGTPGSAGAVAPLVVDGGPAAPSGAAFEPGRPLVVVSEAPGTPVGTAGAPDGAARSARVSAPIAASRDADTAARAPASTAGAGISDGAAASIAPPEAVLVAVSELSSFRGSTAEPLSEPLQPGTLAARAGVAQNHPEAWVAGRSRELELKLEQQAGPHPGEPEYVRRSVGVAAVHTVRLEYLLEPGRVRPAQAVQRPVRPSLMP